MCIIALFSRFVKIGTAGAPEEKGLNQEAFQFKLALDKVQQLFGRGGDGVEVAVVGQDPIRKLP